MQKWGNGLAIRLSSAFAESISIQQGSEVELRLTNRTITVVPRKRKPSLEELLAKITPENRHEAIDLGTEGKELL
ncbi:MAG TPA: AbrB/MazE/SpoVT family DNA-binding domain-containing protein [Alicyclobacillus sp.]|nr:AbrB/MazE/SpoVT family DNA-binding domain-containing protein [Alicyclobacillus sp.]